MAIIFFTLSWYLSKRYFIFLGIYFLLGAALAADMEYHILSLDDCKHLKLNTSAGLILYFVISIMPVNFFLNVVAHRDTLGQLVFAQVQSFLRIVLALTILFVHLVYGEVRLAWSCYMEAPLKDYTKGYCPAYTNDYYDNFACRNAVPGNIACEGGVLPSWKSPHVTLHIAFNLLSALFGQHVINVWVTWVQEINKNK